ncbi:hypothetical protein O3G_MSEX015473 [Manduca sexta]|uniref:Retrovirus-related Pol polyprotein from transposon TNT 1-94 n=1 Tax=Manduca sexta TaxID=7130 RepID=A0A922D2H7_MANSE|nr:hypothetical protein O3G_MSEX015473 [Manduca sexta]
MYHAAGTALVQFEKLKGIENYSTWKFTMKMTLIHEDLWDCITEECDDVQDKDYEKKSLKALAKICLSVNAPAFPHVRNAKTAKEAWSNLSKAYEDKGLCRRLSLLRSLFSTQLVNYDSMDNYLSKLQETSQQLQDISYPLDDEFLAVIMLSGLPGTYDPLIMALENSNIKLSSDVVKGKLLQEHERRDNKTDTATALAASKKSPKCFKCKKSGHLFKDCYKNKRKNFSKDTTAKEMPKMLLTALTTSIQQDVWYVDSGATSHMCNNKSVISDFVSVKPSSVSVANGEKLFTVGQGEVKVRLTNGIRTIKDVFYVPNLSANLLSVSCLVNKGYKVIFYKDKCKIFDKQDMLAIATLENGIYKLDTIGQPLCEGGNNNFVYSVERQDIPSEGKVAVESQEIWHRRLGHLNSKSMSLLRQGMVTGINYNLNIFNPCAECIKGKLSKLPFPKKSYSRATQVLGLVHTDVCGPMPCVSFSGAKYFLTFIDDFTRKTFVYFMRTKDEVFEHFKNFKAMVENETNHKIKILRSDNGGEYINLKLQAFLKNCGIKHQTTVAYSPQQNGVAERANRTIVEKTRCMLLDAGLSNKFWAEAVNTAVYLKNRSPTKAVLGVVPEEKWSNSKVSLSNLRIFGCIAYAVTQNRNKLDSRSKLHIFVGYCENTKGYRLVDPENSFKLVIARNVIFLENRFHNKSHDDTESSESVDVLLNDCSGVSVNDMSSAPALETQTQSTTRQSESFTVSPVLSDDIRRDSTITVDDSDSNDSVYEENSSADPTYILGETTMEEAASSDSGDFSSSESVLLVKKLIYDDDPDTVQEALASTDAAEWHSAMKDEYKSYIDNKCWTLTERPKHQKPIKCRWVFKRKTGLNGELLKYKARLVAKGYTQKHGVDYEETFAPVVRHSTLRTLFAIAAELDMSIDHLDVKTAFLNGNLTENVYMEQPDGFKVKGKEHMVYKLNKAIYGLKQASKMWYDKINKILLQKLHFKKTASEPCVFYHKDKNHLIILALYVDDMLLFSTSSSIKETVKNALMHEFEMRDLGPIHNILGMKVIKSKNKVTLDQSGYILKVLEKFNMLDCKPAKTPLEKGIKFPKCDKKDERFCYRNLIGCLMYIAVCSRPDIAHAVSLLSQYNESFTETHWKAAKRVLRYLKGTLNYGLVFQKGGLEVTGHVDADWAGNDVDRKSYTGFIFKIGNSLVSWESRKQRTVALSSTEAEYMALSDACKEALFVRNFLIELLNIECKVLLYNDNQSALKLTSNSMFHSRTKHIDVRHHFIRDTIKGNMIDVKYLSTNLMIADVLTKPLSKEKHDQFVKGLCLTILT